MGKVYQNPLYNILATGASKNDQGGFTDREPSLVSPCTVKSARTNTSSQTYHVVEF
jgi:hypothetical protein